VILIASLRVAYQFEGDINRNPETKSFSVITVTRSDQKR